MNTPIYDFVKAYTSSTPARLHMPGHKGRGPLGCEAYDITEIPGADSLYEADGIIAESEANASRLFGCPSFYSTEGSSHCIRAMLFLAMQSCHSKPCPEQRRRGSEESVLPAAQEAARQGIRDQGSEIRDRECRDEHRSSADMHCLSLQKEADRFRVLAARNCHKAFLSAAALLDLDVVWLPASKDSYLSVQPTPEGLDAVLTESGADAVYLTCPDYLGFLPELRPLAEVCHAHGALLLVDNAHGAYLRFLTPSRHPMDLGADLCCDSAHKTLPVLTGGAYLHVAERLCEAAKTSPACRGGGPASRPVEGCRPSEARDQGSGIKDQGSGIMNQGSGIRNQGVRDALALFGSSSPSYLILQSLDLANPYLETLPERLAGFVPQVEALKARLRAAGWTVVGDEPLKLTLNLRPVGTSIACPLASRDPSGPALAAALEQAGIYCEFFDADYLVCMLTPENTPEDLRRLEAALLDENVLADGQMRTSDACPCAPLEAAAATDSTSSGIRLAGDGGCELPRKGKAVVCSIREAMLSPSEQLPARESLGRVLARPGVSCPPAVPILMPGEVIDAAAVVAFAKYGIETVSVLP